MQKENTPKSFAGNSLYIFTAKFFPGLAIALAFYLYSHRLPMELNGQYQNFWIQLLMLSALASIGIPAFAITYSPALLLHIYYKIKRKHYFIYTGFLLLLAVIFGLLQQQYNNLPFFLALCFFLLYIPTVIAEALLMVSKRLKILIAINFIFSVFFFLLHWHALQQNYNLALLIKALMILTLARGLISGIIVRQAFSNYKNDTIQLPHENWTSIKKLWLQLGLNDLLQASFRWIDKFILSLFLIKSLSAIYFNATYDVPFLPLIFSAVSSAALIHWANSQLTHTPNEQIKILHYSSRILSSIVFPLFFFLFFFRVELLTILFSEKYVSGVWIFVCAQLVLPVRSYPFSTILQNHQRGDIIIKGAFIDLVIACILMYPMYLLMGLPGVALSFVISTYWQAGFYLLHSARILKVNAATMIPIKNLVIKFVFFAFLFGTGYYFVANNNFSATTILIIGSALLILSSSSMLIYEWNKDVH